MFPLNVDMPVIKKDGTRTTLGDITGDVSSLVDDLESLDSRLDTAEGNLTGTYLSLGSKIVTLATADGTKTCSALMTEALTALQALVPSTEMTGANHMKPVYVAMPYGDSAATRTILIPESGLSPVASFGSSSYKFIRIDATPAGDGITIWNADFAATNKWFMQTVTTGALSDFLTRKPSNSTTLDVLIEFYKKID